MADILREELGEQDVTDRPITMSRYLSPSSVEFKPSERPSASNRLL